MRKEPVVCFAQFNAGFSRRTAELLLLIVASCLFPLFLDAAAKEEQSVLKKAEQLSRALRSIFEDGTKHEEIAKAYATLADADIFSPEAELKLLNEDLERYLRERAAIAWNAKLSLEQREFYSEEEEEWTTEKGGNASRMDDLNNSNKHSFVRYFNVKKMSDDAILFRVGNFGGSYEVNGSMNVTLRPNPSFFGLPTSSDCSAVHVPTPIYDRDPKLLERIRWSNIDQQFRRNREQLKDLSFQKFCSDSGFMRFFPCANWSWEDRKSELDLFDCRNTEWYVGAATAPRNVIILLDTSGSMLGQRFEIARQTIESILSTLSDNDFFNIVQFSKTNSLLEQCGERELVQASLRNKKVLLSRLNNISSEGKADYEKALQTAFTTLMNIRKFTGNQKQMGCQDVIILITDGAPGFFKEIFELFNKDKRIRFFSFVVGEEAKDFEQVRWMACSNRGFMAHVVSMADVQEKVQQFVRVLSRTVARQKAAFSEGTPLWSGATRERVSEQLAISVSFPVVLPDGQFMGVSSVSVPLAELAQLAHPVRVGARSHFILLDANGYLLLHPQLRPFDSASGELKAGFNSVEFVDAEVQRPLPLRRISIDCSTGTMEPRQLNTLFAIDELRHIYPEQRHYHAACIPGTPYTIVLSLPKGNVQRLRRTHPLHLSSLQGNWLLRGEEAEEENEGGGSWRLQPGWRYCLLNDSDWELGAEGAFREYARQMRETGKMPELCKPREKLVERTLLDLQASDGFAKLWAREWERNRKNGVHLAFFVATSGVIRFKNESLGERFLYEHREPQKGEEEEKNSENSQPQSYRHFLLELNPNAAEADFFHRAAHQPEGRITFDLNRKTRLFHNKEGKKTDYGWEEKDALLALAYKAVRVDGALAGVAGIEFLYDSLVAQMRHIGCMPEGGNDRSRCYLLDEHGFVLFSGSPRTKYAEFVHENILTPELAARSEAHNWSGPRRRKGGAGGARGVWTQRSQAHNHYQQQQFQHHANRHQQQQQQASHLELGRFFGQLNRVTEWTMRLLVRRGFYKRGHFTDAQAICDPPSQSVAEPVLAPTVAADASSSLSRLPTLRWIASSLLRLLFRLGSLLSVLLIPAELTASLQLTTFSSLLKVTDGRFPCRAHTAFYLGQTGVKADGADGALLESNSYERPCPENAAQCAVRAFASWVPHTNLLLVVIRQDARSQCFHRDSASHCPLSDPPAIPFGFSPNLPAEALDSDDQSSSENFLGVDRGSNIECAVSQPKERSQPIQCIRDDFLEDDADEETCSGTTSTKWMHFLNSLIAVFVAIAMLRT